MPPHIHISQNKKDHLAAAKALSARLFQLGIRHAYIGGFAWSLLGSIRPTEDIDVLIQDGGDLDVRHKLMDLDPQFVDMGFKLFYITEVSPVRAPHVYDCLTTVRKKPDGEMVREEILMNSTNNVHVETLSAGSLGLPSAIISTFITGEAEVEILHPGILILTKFKRWSINHTSTRPKTIRKVASDRSDIQFIIEWLAENRERIRFDEYKGKAKPELLAMIRKYYDKYADNEEHMEKLRSIMPDDWDDMLALPEPELESTMPP